MSFTLAGDTVMPLPSGPACSLLIPAEQAEDSSMPLRYTEWTWTQLAVLYGSV